MRRLLSPLLVISLVTLGSAAPGGAQTERTHDTDLSRPLDAGAMLEIDDISGSITATAATGNVAMIVARARSRDGDPASVRVVATKLPGKLVVCTIYPGEDRSTCGAGENHHGNDHTDIQVDFTIGVPRGHRFEGTSVSGDVTARGLSDDVDVRSVAGSVTVQTSGTASARTVSGSITASIGAVPRDGELSFTSVNGAIELTLPRSTNADLRARTMNGKIDIDNAFHVPLSSNFVGGSAAGRIGGGGATLRLETLNGSIRVLAG